MQWQQPRADRKNVTLLGGKAPHLPVSNYFHHKKLVMDHMHAGRNQSLGGFRSLTWNFWHFTIVKILTYELSWLAGHQCLDIEPHDNIHYSKGRTKVEIPYPVKIRWFASKIWSNNHEIIFQDRREGLMKNASCFIFFCLVQKIP
jgi:hypothetical protein